MSNDNITMGLLTYGFSEDDVNILKKKIIYSFESEIIILSASLRENNTVKEIIDMTDHSVFESKENRFIMFLGFEDELMMQFLKLFPGNIKRPIFCGLTDSNINWKVSFLMDHLIEEKRRFETGSDD